MNRTKGFTLIELLVVIAVIGILAAVVLASLGSARDKGKDKAIISDLLNARTEIQSYFSTNGYIVNSGSSSAACPISGSPTITAFLSPKVVEIMKHADTLVGGTGSPITNVHCAGSTSQWAVVAKLKTAGYWCLDSAGTSRNKLSTGGGYTGFVNASTAALTDGNDFTCN